MAKWMTAQQFIDHKLSHPNTGGLDRAIARGANNVMQNGSTGEQLLALPFVWLWGWITGPSQEPAPPAPELPPPPKVETEKERQKRLRTEKQAMITLAKQQVSGEELDYALRWIDDEFRSRGLN